jgi:hypothetical protein
MTNGVERGTRCEATAYLSTRRPRYPNDVRGTIVHPPFQGAPVPIDNANTGRPSKPSGHQLT